MKAAWSNPVTHDDVFLVPRYLVGVKAARFGSNDPVSSVNTDISLQTLPRQNRDDEQTLNSMIGLVSGMLSSLPPTIFDGSPFGESKSPTRIGKGWPWDLKVGLRGND
jgi:hypothetical protein